MYINGKKIKNHQKRRNKDENGEVYIIGKKIQKEEKNYKRKKGKKKERVQSEMKIMYTNANGITGKMNSLKTILIQEDIHIATIAETKLRGQPPSIDGYSWINKNRQRGAGGGIAILIRNDILQRYVQSIMMKILMLKYFGSHSGPRKITKT